jgi:hypothetical protein
MIRPTPSRSDPVVFEVAPFRHVWILRRRGSYQETLYLTREEALERAETLCRLEGPAELVVMDREIREGAEL